MGIPVLILGESGSGKSASLRSFDPGEVVIYNVAGKPLPFRNGAKMIKADNPTYAQILGSLAKGTVKRYVVDDSQYLLCFELFDRSAETGYTKFTEMAKHFYDLIRTVIRRLPNDTIVYFLHHTELSEGRYKAKYPPRIQRKRIKRADTCQIIRPGYRGSG